MEMTGSMELKAINNSDLEFVRSLRNLYREWFFDDKIISENAQKNWFKDYVKKNYLGFYIIFENDKRIGTISLRKHKSDSLINPTTGEHLVLDEDKLTVDCFIEISNLMIHPNLARKGIMYQAIQQIMSESCNYIAFVKGHNIKSANLFRKLGFKETLQNNWLFFQTQGIILPRKQD